ncbi:MAG TPA: histidine kinase dimerization/phospho-acceptor domain-containing protein, partial [bacterium]|nr:histidine kinase dimerization/phospho-acceptor domain-containing protein [bacterium]
MEEAQAANRAKSYFLATVSHELRTPLNAVIGFSELLQSGDVPPEERRDFLRSINFAGTALLNLINDVLDLSKLEADQMNMVFTKTDV